MKHLLNERTGTVHKTRPDTTGTEAACGALRHVAPRHVTSVATTETPGGTDEDRCGRCFDDAGGY